MPQTLLRSALVAFSVTALLAGCAPVKANSTNLSSDQAGTDIAQPAPQRPGLVVTNAPAPQVIYAPGTRDAILTNANGKMIPALDDDNIVTPVTKKAEELHRELDHLRENVDTSRDQLRGLKNTNEARADKYYETVAGISAALQGGTTRGNPILVERWNDAQQKLDAMAQDSGQLTNITTDLNNEASRASFLLDSVQDAFSISGAVPADHRKLGVVQDGVQQELSQINSLLTEANDEVTHHAAFLQSQQADMQTLALGIANGELYGKNLTNSLFQKAASGSASVFDGGQVVSSAGGGLPVRRKPLVIIRFDRPDVQYKQALYTAVNQALRKFPAAKFDLVAVSNMEGNAAQLALSAAEARKNGERVLRSLQDMGLPLSRIRLSAASGKNVLNSEVHLYLQ
ncbi:MAG: hypothetical protein KGL10_04005 [Alphaproteobacteria bacterium]|nr:hypothetical protein [Alphaproteobacteria bacterium]